MDLMSDRDALTTYRYLRIAMPLLVVLLAAAVVNQVFAPEPDCWLGSISAYYYTAARAIFVACLCAMGVSLIIYSGNTTREDFVLNVSGFLAFVVALVPTPLKELVISPADEVGPANEPVCKRSNVPTNSQLNAAIDNNVWALLVTATVVVVVVLWFRRVQGAPAVSGAVLVLVVALALAWGIFLIDRSVVREDAHLVAAVGMFAGIIGVVMMNAFTKQVIQPLYRSLYRVILAAMIAAVLILGSIAWGEFSEHAVFWLESALIVLFGVFWVVQTKELWNQESRSVVPESAVTETGG